MLTVECIITTRSALGCIFDCVSFVIVRINFKSGKVLIRNLYKSLKKIKENLLPRQTFIEIKGEKGPAYLLP